MRPGVVRPRIESRLLCSDFQLFSASCGDLRSRAFKSDQDYNEHVHGQVYVHRERIGLSVLKDGLEKLRYDAVVAQLKTG